MDIYIPQPETAVYFCDSCSCCCEDHPPVHPSDVKELSKLTGMPVNKIAFDMKGAQRCLFLRRNGSDACLFLEGRKCSVYENRPLICRKFPVAISAKLSEDAVSIALNHISDVSCPSRSYNRKISPQELFGIIEKGLRIKAARMLVEKGKDIERYVDASFEIVNSMALDSAVDALMQRGQFVLI